MVKNSTTAVPALIAKEHILGYQHEDREGKQHCQALV
jgi:hypothetical protein